MKPHHVLHHVLLPVILLVALVAPAVGCKASISHTAPPTATDDSYDGFGMTALSVLAASGVLTNDAPDGGTVTGNTTPANGTVVMNSDGSFTYTPDAGFRGATDTFDYTVTNSAGSVTATVTINLSGFVWYVDNSLGSNGDGRSSSPFNSIANFNAGATVMSNDIVYLHTGSGSYDGTVSLAGTTGSQVIGEGVALQVGINTLRTAGTRPTLGAATGNAITLGTDNTVSGLNFGAVPNGYALADNGASVGNLTVSSSLVNGNAGAVRIANGSGSTTSITFDSINATGSSDHGIQLVSFNGSFTVSGTTAVGTTTNFAIRIDTLTATGSVTFTGATTITSPGGDGISISTTATGSSVTFGDVGITGQIAVGIAVSGLAGTLTMNDVTIGSPSGSAGDAINIASASNNTTFNSTTINASDADGIAIASQSAGTINFGTTVLDNCTADGVQIQSQTGGTVQFTSTTVNATSTTAATAIAASSCSGGTLTFGTTAVTGRNGVTVSSGTSTASFNNLSVTATDGTGFGAVNAGTVTLTGTDAAISSTNGTGVIINGTAGADENGPGWVFGAITTTNGSANAVRLLSLTNNFTATSVTVNGISATGIEVSNSPSVTISFGTTTLGTTTTIDQGVSIITSAGASVSFTSLQVVADNGTGFLANDVGTLTFAGTAPTINATGGPALDLTTIATISGSVGNLVSTNSGTTGIAITTVAASLTVAGTTNLSGATSHGISISNSTGSFTFGTTTITNPGGDGINLATVTSFSLASTGGGITMPAGSDNDGIQADTVTTLGINGVSGNPFVVSNAGLGTTDNQFSVPFGPHGIFAQNCTTVTVQFVQLSNIGEVTTNGTEAGIYVYNFSALPSTITISDNTILENVDGPSISVINQTATSGGSVPTITITDNTCGMVTGQAGSEFAIVVSVDGFDVSADVTIRGNTITTQGNNSGGGIFFEAVNSAGNNDAVLARIGGTTSGEENTITDRGGVGITVSLRDGSTARVDVANNVLSNSGGANVENEGIAASVNSTLGSDVTADLTLRGNSFSGYNAASIIDLRTLGGSQESVVRMTVDANTFASGSAAEYAVLALAGNDYNDAGAAGNGRFQVRVTNMDVSGTLGIAQAMFGSNDSLISLLVDSNTVDASGEIAVDASNGGTDEIDIGDTDLVTAPNPPLLNTNATNVESVLSNQNTNAGTTSAAAGAGTYNIIDATTIPSATLP